MPRNRKVDNDEDEPKTVDMEEDYLEVDKPLPAQNFYCVSFVSPEKVLKRKELYTFYHYEKAFNKQVATIFNEGLTNLIDSADDAQMVSVAELVKLRKKIQDTCAEFQVSNNTTFEEFENKFDDFMFRDEEKINEEFDKNNNFKTSVRGIKVRGVFNTKREADVRASVLQRLDPSFDVFVGQIGYWCPWDPNPQKIEDIEYLDKNLNNLVKEYKLNEAKKDQFYNDQKTARQKDVIKLSQEERIKHQLGLNQTIEESNAQKSIAQDAQESITEQSMDSKQKNIIDMNNLMGGMQNDITPDIAIDSTTDAVMNDADPWMQRKITF